MYATIRSVCQKANGGKSENCLRISQNKTYEHPICKNKIILEVNELINVSLCIIL